MRFLFSAGQALSSGWELPVHLDAGELAWRRKVCSMIRGQELLARATRAYVRHFPFERGKARLIQLATRLGPRSYLRTWVRDVLMDLELEDLHQNLVFFRGYEERTIDLARRLLRNGDSAVDVGANIGLHTLQFAKAVFPEGHVHAFEPMPDLCVRLSKHLELNELGNVTVNEFALAGREGTAHLHVSSRSNYAMHSFSRENAGLNNGGSPVAGFEIKCRRLDDYLRERGVANLKLLKVDVEGAELQVFQGSAELLGSDPGPVVVFEASDLLARPFGHSSADVKALLAAHGYQLYRYSSEGLARVSVEQPHRLEDLIAAKPEHRLGELFPRV